MFKILGNDGKEYGPVSAEQIHQWLREGRAGAATRVQREGASEWLTLGALPEFAALLAAPTPVVTAAQGMPPAVRWIAQAMFVVTAFSLLMTLWSIASVMTAMSRHSFQPGRMLVISYALAVLGLPLRVAVGIGLLRGREWARQLGIYLSIVLIVMGAWGLSRTFGWLLQPQSWSVILQSPSALISTLFSVTLFLFNIVVVIVLTRPAVRAAFQTKANPV